MGDGQKIAMLHKERVELQAENESLRVYARKLERLVQTLVDNDPDEQIADSGEVVLDLWRHEAKIALGEKP